jgi:hypothetical protein
MARKVAEALGLSMLAYDSKAVGLGSGDSQRAH